MAQRREVVDICDRCRSDQGVQKRQIKLPADGNRQVTFDACAECRRTVPLAEWEKLLPVRRTGGRSLNTATVVSSLLPPAAPEAQGRRAARDS